MQVKVHLIRSLPVWDFCSQESSQEELKFVQFKHIQSKEVAVCASYGRTRHVESLVRTGRCLEGFKSSNAVLRFLMGIESFIKLLNNCDSEVCLRW